MVNQTQLVIYSPLGGLGGALNEIPQCDHDDEQVCDRNKQHTVAANKPEHDDALPDNVV